MEHEQVEASFEPIPWDSRAGIEGLGVVAV